MVFSLFGRSLPVFVAALVFVLSPPSISLPIASSATLVTQLGVDIDGESAGDQFGWAVALSADGSRMVVGATGDDEVGINAGHVRVYEWSGSGWVQLGTDLDGEAAEDGAGYSVALSSDGTRVAFGAIRNDGNGANAGHVRVFDWNGVAWVQLGGDIDGEASGDQTGWSVSLSSDGSRIAVGAAANAGNGASAGHVRVFDWNGVAWVQLGSDIDGEAAGDSSGRSISISSDGTRLAIGAPLNDGNGSIAGHVRVFDWNGAAWVQLGGDIDGEAAGDLFGLSVSLSPDGSRVASGAPGNSGAGSGAGHVRVFDWNGAAWVQLGADIDGEAAGDAFGRSISMSSDGVRIAIGAPYNDGTGPGAGHARAYDWNGVAWVQLGADIDGEATGDQFGYSVSLSWDASRMAVGADQNSGNGVSSGHTRVFSLSSVLETSEAPELPGSPGIYLYVAGGPGRLVEGTLIHHGSTGVSPNSFHILRVESMGAPRLTSIELSIDKTNRAGHLESQTPLGALAPGMYKIVVTGQHQLGHSLVLTNHISVDGSGRFISVSSESLQPVLR